VTHNEAISIPDFFTVRRAGKVVYRPTCHYAYHPATRRCSRSTRCSGQAGKVQEEQHILEEDEIVDGIDELGVLLYGHGRNAYWYGSQLSIEETRRIAPYQNATGPQVTSAVLAGMVWALENPNAGIVEADEIDFRRCLEVQMPYLGPVKGYYTDWTPLTDRPGLLPRGHRRERSLAVPQRAGAVSLAIRLCHEDDAAAWLELRRRSLREHPESFHASPEDWEAPTRRRPRSASAATS
jgi:homospermidine synthase